MTASLRSYLIPLIGEGTTDAPMTSGSKFLLTASSLSSLEGTNHFWCWSSPANAPTWLAWAAMWGKIFRNPTRWEEEKRTFTATSSEGKAKLSSEPALFGAQFSILTVNVAFSPWTGKSKKIFQWELGQADKSHRLKGTLVWILVLKGQVQLRGKTKTLKRKCEDKKWTRVKATTGEQQANDWRIGDHQLFISDQPLSALNPINLDILAKILNHLVLKTRQDTSSQYQNSYLDLAVW